MKDNTLSQDVVNLPEQESQDLDVPQENGLMAIVHQHLGQKTGQLSLKKPTISLTGEILQEGASSKNKAFHCFKGKPLDLQSSDILLPEGSISFLNSSESDLSSGLEYLLPTPATRYRVTLRRLKKEMRQLDKKIELYQSLKPLPEGLKPLVKAMTRRLTIMKNQSSRLSMRLSILDKAEAGELLTLCQSLFKNAGHYLRYLGTDILKSAGRLVDLLPLTQVQRGKKRLRVLYFEMKALKAVMLDIKTYHPSAMAVYYNLLSRYEARLAEANRLKTVLQ